MILQTVFLSVFLWPVLATSGWLGVYLADSETEVRIAEVIPGSPAEKSGLKAGDVILELNGEGRLTIEAFVARVQSHEAGDRVRLKVRRGETELEIQVRLAPRAEVLGQAPQAVPQRAFLGVGVREEVGGLVVDHVIAGSPAAQAGIAPGDRLLRLHGESVGHLQDLDRIMAGLAPGTQISVNIENEKGSASLIIVLATRSGTSPGFRAAPPPAPPSREAAPLGFASSLPEAQRQARRQGRPLLLVFGASWSPESQAQRRSLRGESLREALEGYVRVWLDTDRAGQLAEAHSVRELPHIEILGPDGQQVYEHAGYLPPESLLKVLRARGSVPDALAEEQLRDALVELERLNESLEELREVLQALLRRDR